MRISSLSLVALLASLAFIHPADAQRRSPKAKPTSPQPRFETRPFNPDVGKLPPQYVGHSFGDLYLALSNRKKVTVKGEFESTIDFNARVATINARPLVGTVDVNSLLAFTFLPDGEQFVMKYDADLTALNISLKWRRQYEFGSYDNKFYALTWSENSRKVGPYVGRNILNRGVRVSVYRNDDYYLTTGVRNLDEIPGFKDEALGYSLETSILMPPDDARLAKTNMRALVIGRLAALPVLYSENRDTPEVTDPMTVITLLTPSASPSRKSGFMITPAEIFF